MESAQLLKAKEVLLLEDDLILGKRIEAYLTTLGMEVQTLKKCLAPYPLTMPCLISTCLMGKALIS